MNDSALKALLDRLSASREIILNAYTLPKITEADIDHLNLMLDQSNVFESSIAKIDVTDKESMNVAGQLYASISNWCKSVSGLQSIIGQRMQPLSGNNLKDIYGNF